MAHPQCQCLDIDNVCDIYMLSMKLLSLKKCFSSIGNVQIYFTASFAFKSKDSCAVSVSILYDLVVKNSGTIVYDDLGGTLSNFMVWSW